MSRRTDAPVIPEGDDVDPHPDDYDPKSVRADCDAVKDLLLWARKEGFPMQTLTVGQIQIVGVGDLYPRRSIAQAMGRGRPDGEAESRGGRTEAENEFATDEEIEILNRERG